MQRRRVVDGSGNSLRNRSAFGVKFWLRPAPPLRGRYVLVIERAVVELVIRMRTNRRSLRLEHLSDLSKRLAPIDPSSLEFHRNGYILLWPITRA